MAGKRTMSSGCWIWPRLRWSAAGSARTRALAAAQWLWEFAPASTSSLSSAKSHQFLYFSHQMVQALETYLVTATFLLAAIRVPQEEEWKCLMSFFFFFFAKAASEELLLETPSESQSSRRLESRRLAALLPHKPRRCRRRGASRLRFPAADRANAELRFPEDTRCISGSFGATFISNPHIAAL